MLSVAERIEGSEGAFPALWPRLTHDSAHARHYRLCCPACGATSADDGYQLTCAGCQTPSLLKALYRAGELAFDDREEGIFRYRNWLPVRRSLPGAPSTMVYRSERLSLLTGLKNLWIAFNGYWPERGGKMLTGSFKELEAYCELGRVPAENGDVMVVCSAGNTAAAFARVASQTGTPCLILIPEDAIDSLRLAGPVSDCVKVVAVSGGADYSDVIRFGDSIARTPGFFAEGGAKNVARRAGLGTVLLSAFEELKRMPDYYFQAIGSGTGAIAVHETAQRITTGRGAYPRLWLSQNLPFTPVFDAWMAGARQLTPAAEETAKRKIGQMGAKVLANRFPAYAVRGGLYEALTESGGTVLGVTNAEAARAADVFEMSEGIDLAPAAAVAFASLLQAAKENRIPRAATVVLNVTGGGQQRRLRETEGDRPHIDLSIDAGETGSLRSIEKIAGLFEEWRRSRLPCASMKREAMLHSN